MNGDRATPGTRDGRAVSTVIGVILMVALTVVMAAIIATFVLGLGDTAEQEAQAGVTIDVVEGTETVQVDVTTTGNAAYVNLTSTDWDGMDGDEDNVTRMTTGDTVTLSVPDGDIDDAGQVTAIAVRDDGEVETQVRSERWDFS